MRPYLATFAFALSFVAVLAPLVSATVISTGNLTRSAQDLSRGEVTVPCYSCLDDPLTDAKLMVSCGFNPGSEGYNMGTLHSGCNSSQFGCNSCTNTSTISLQSMTNSFYLNGTRMGVVGSSCCSSPYGESHQTCITFVTEEYFSQLAFAAVVPVLPNCGDTRVVPTTPAPTSSTSDSGNSGLSASSGTSGMSSLMNSVVFVGVFAALKLVMFA